MATTQEALKPATMPAFWNVRNWRLGTKLLGAFLLVLFVSLTTSGLLAIRTSRDALLSEGILSLTALNSGTSRAIDTYLDSRREDTVAVSNSSTVAAFIANPNDAAEKAKALKELRAMANRKFYESMAIASQDGKVLLSTIDQDINTSIKNVPYFVEAMKGASYISDIYLSKTTNQPSIFLSAPIADPTGGVAGVLVSRLSFYGVWDLVENDTDAAGPGTLGILLDENGIRIAHGASLANRFAAERSLLYTAVEPLSSDKQKQLAEQDRLGGAPANKITVRPLPEVAAAMANPDLRAFESSPETGSVRHYAVISSLEAKPWRYVLMTPLPTFTHAADTLGTQFLVLTVIIIAITSILVVLLARAWTQPIVYLTRVAERISIGDLDAEIEINRKDEIGELAQALRRMQTSVRMAVERARQHRKATQ